MVLQSASEYPAQLGQRSNHGQLAMDHGHVGPCLFYMKEEDILSLMALSNNIDYRNNIALDVYPVYINDTKLS